eukprot:Opistho-2@89543
MATISGSANGGTRTPGLSRHGSYHGDLDDSAATDMEDMAETDMGMDSLKSMQRGVTIGKRGAMGEFIPEKGYSQLSSLAYESPSPASYIIVTPPSNPQYSILGKYRSEKCATDMPGPAAYDTRGDPEHDARSFTLSSKGKMIPVDWTGDEAVPGPVYNPATESLAASTKGQYTIKGRHSVRVQGGPSPSQYPPHYHFGDGHKKSIGYREDITHPRPNGIPGPADYGVSPVGAVKSASPAYTLAARISPCEPDLTPGPGEHYTRAEFGGAKKASIKGRKPELKKMNGPGPGTYNINEEPIGPKYSLYSRRVPSPGSNVPGPAEYTVTTELHTKRTLAGKCAPGFPVILQYPDQLKSKTASPGPAAYLARPKECSAAYTIKGR